MLVYLFGILFHFIKNAFGISKEDDRNSALLGTIFPEVVTNPLSVDSI